MAEPAKEEANEEEVEYESDPEETKLTLKMRRREASDDEEEGDVMEEKVKPSRRIVESDVESDGQGGAADYDEEEGEDDEYVEEEVDEELIADDEEYVDEGEVEYEQRGVKVGSVADEERVELRGEGSRGPREGIQDLNEDKLDENNLIDDSNREEEEEEEDGKKENEPYAVPTAGAFYMHDDRFRDNAGGRGRRTFAGRKLWESKDEKKWGHDKFEEFTSQERHYEGGRRGSRGRFRGRGRFRSQERGYAQGNSSRGGYNTTNDQSRVANNINAPRTVRGRGPRRYQQTSYKNNNEAPNQNQQPGKSAEKSSHSVSARMSTSQPNVESESAPVKKNTFASSLNYASPPFYPSGSSSDNFTQKRDGHPVGTNQNARHVADQSSSAMHPGSMPRRRAVVDSMGMDKLYIDDSLPAVAGKPLNLPVSSSSAVNSNQSFQLRGQGRGANSLPQMTYQPTGNRIPPTVQHSTQRNPVVSQGQSSGQQYAQSSRGGSQVSSPKASQSESSFEPAEVESLSESINSKTSVISKGKVNVQGGGRGSFLYGGAPVMGASGSLGGGHGDQNFPAFLPVMQFAGQRPGGMGVPAVGMAFPGYVGQPQLGLGNSEMTWLPVLTGAAGALHATYGSPYMNADGAYPGRPSGQSSSSAPMIKDNTANKPNNDLNPSQRHEAGNDEFGQRQKNPRRYTEMKFDH